MPEVTVGNAMIEYTHSKKIVSTLSKAALTWVLLTATANAQDAADEEAFAAGQAQYQIACAACHEGALPEAPQRAALRLYQPNRIIAALESGVMSTQGMLLSREEMHQMAYFLTGQHADDSIPELASFSCETELAEDHRLTKAVGWNGFGGTQENSRFQGADGGLNKENVGQLALKWAFAYPNATRARSQPVVTPEVTYVGSQDGTIYALDSNNGCPWWTFTADAEVRGSIHVQVDSDNVPKTLLFGDFSAQTYAIDAHTGELIWKTEVHDHPQATITGAVTANETTVIVPVSSSEIILASRVEYQCCSFRGALVALDINSGNVLWRTYTTDTPRPTLKSSAGTQQFGPSGAPIWGSPTIDTERNIVYAGTGENYSSPANDLSDAILAINMDNGEIIWATQLTENDAWNGACSSGNPNCPEENGPDYDIGASPILTTTVDGRDFVLVGQKSGMVYALDIANGGEIAWQQRVGSGGTMGGIHWGMSSNGEKVFVGVSDLPTNNRFNVGPRHPGVHALDLRDGSILWRNDLPYLCEESPFLCFQGISAAVSSAPGLVFAGGLDGRLRAFDDASGDILWETETWQSFGERNGIAAMGGSIEADGPVVVNGQVFVNSGYEKWNQAPGNVLLVYSVNGE